MNPNAATGPRFKHGRFEFNDDRFADTHIGANAAVKVDPTTNRGTLVNPFGDGQVESEKQLKSRCDLGYTAGFRLFFDTS